MMPFIPLMLVFAALTSAAPVVLARDEPEPDGVHVDKMPWLRKWVSEEQLEAQAAQQYSDIKRQVSRHDALVADDHPEVRRLRAIARKLIPHATRWNARAAQWQWEVNLIGSKEINAFCMPGGKIAFYSGILSTLKLTDDEVAIVMGHEIAHALREHGRERAAKSGLASVGAQLAGIGLSALLGLDRHTATTATGSIANLTMLKFSRDDETEADLVGLDLAARAGYDPRAGIALWQKMDRVGRNATPQWLSTHPAGKSRIAEMQKHMPSVMPLYARAVGRRVSALPPYSSNVAGIAPVR
jgi:predicted Zn-dependent protease